VILDSAPAEILPVNEILPRKNSFVRGLRNGSKQLLAANLDQVLIVIAPEPAPSKDLLERYLVAVHSLEIAPVIVVNKCELLPPDPDKAKTPFSRLDAYQELGYTVLRTSCKAEPGLQGLPAVLDGKTSILVGQSGVGKSSLVNQLVPDLELQTQALSHSTGKGKHTTTSTMMYQLPTGGRLIDSPGVWEYGLWEMETSELQYGFPEFEKAQTNCRFNNCKHLTEPGCSLTAAVTAGLIPQWRLDSYRRLLQQGAHIFSR
jgi:ribosome biogenesis GTPase